MDDVVMASALRSPIGGAMNVTRTARPAHGGPVEVAAATVDPRCGSSPYARVGTTLVGGDPVSMRCRGGLGTGAWLERV